MKRQLLVVLIGALILAMAAGCSKGYESEKRTGSMNIILKADRYPLVKGDNTLSITLLDQEGKPITDAAVSARYYMPPMPGMAPMDFRTETMRKGGSYLFTANPSMEGGWKVEVSVTRPNGQTAVSTFNLDAR